MCRTRPLATKLPESATLGRLPPQLRGRCAHAPPHAPLSCVPRADCCARASLLSCPPARRLPPFAARCGRCDCHLSCSVCRVMCEDLESDKRYTALPLLFYLPNTSVCKRMELYYWHSQIVHGVHDVFLMRSRRPRRPPPPRPRRRRPRWRARSFPSRSSPPALAPS